MNDAFEDINYFYDDIKVIIKYQHWLLLLASSLRRNMKTISCRGSVLKVDLYNNTYNTSFVIGDEYL
jgi:hypothetical protein